MRLVDQPGPGLGAARRRQQRGVVAHLRLAQRIEGIGLDLAEGTSTTRRAPSGPA